MSLNVGSLDKNIRIVLGIILIALGFVVGIGSGWGIVLGVVGLIALVTGLINFCPLYALLNLSTRKE